jgi:NADP-dependent 3-hydroxy acid dehydrogenase YdfG
LGENVRACTFDVTNHDAVKQAFHEIGKVDVLINNAGVLGPVDYFHRSQPDEWFEALDIHLKGTVHCTHAVLPGMIERKQGIVINVASNAGAFRWPYCSSYSVAKAALIKLTENLSMETRKKGIAHFAWHPGLVHSVGLAVDSRQQASKEGSPMESVMRWFDEEKEKGRTVTAEQSATSLGRLVSGELNVFSGRYLTVYDDFDNLLLSQKQIQHDDALMLRIKSPAA